MKFVDRVFTISISNYMCMYIRRKDMVDQKKQNPRIHDKMPTNLGINTIMRKKA